jgi:hypothetical protein
MTNYDKNKWTTQPQKPKPQEKPTPEKINLNPLNWLASITKVIKKDGGNRNGN